MDILPLDRPSSLAGLLLVVVVVICGEHVNLLTATSEVCQSMMADNRPAADGREMVKYRLSAFYSSILLSVHSLVFYYRLIDYPSF